MNGYYFDPMDKVIMDVSGVDNPPTRWIPLTPLQFKIFKLTIDFSKEEIEAALRYVNHLDNEDGD